jgi:hypothetical protein
MPLRNLNKSDLWFTTDGDFLIDGAGDLKDTLDSGDNYESLKQAILHRIISERNAFRFHPEVNAGLEQFIGKTIDKLLLEAIQTAIQRALTADSALTRDDFTLRVVELTPGTVAILVYVNLPDQQHPLVSMSWSIRGGDVTRIL